MDASSVPRSVALVQARAWTDQKRWDRVVELIPKLLAENPEVLEAYLLAARAHINAGNHRMAQRLSQECVRLGPNNVEARYLAAFATNTRLANKHLKAALALNPTWAPLHQLQAHFYLVAQQRDKALESLRLAKQLAPGNADISGELVQLESTGRYLPSEVRKTTQQYKEALMLDPDNANLHYKLGKHLLNLEDDFVGALQSLTVALRSDATNKTYQQAYLRALRRTDPFIKALLTPYLWAQFFDRLIHRKHTSKREETLFGILAIPMFLLWLTCIVLFLIFFTLPVMIYARLTLAEFRAQSISLMPGDQPGWSWSRWPQYWRYLTMALLFALPWTLVGLSIWHVEIMLGVALLMLVVAIIDTARCIGQWVGQGWRERHRPLGILKAFFRVLVPVGSIGAMLGLSFYDKDTFMIWLIFWAILIVPFTLYRWHRAWIS